MKPVIIQTGKKTPRVSTVTQVLLLCGILASLLYTAMNIFTPMLYEGYNPASQVVSELSAIDAPTRPLWVVLGTTYTLLVAAFGLGIWLSAGQNRLLRIMGVLMFFSGIIGLAWTPMHKREVVAAGGGTFTDTWHIVMSVITLLFMMIIIALGAAAFGKRFRIYSIASIVLFVVFGILTGLEAPAVSRNDATPMIGVWERINIGIYMLWMFVLAIVLLTAGKRTESLTSTIDNKQSEKVTGYEQKNKIKQAV